MTVTHLFIFVLYTSVFNRGSTEPQGSASGCQELRRNRPKMPFSSIWFIADSRIDNWITA